MKEIKKQKNTFNSSKEYFEFLAKQKSLKQATFAGGCFWCIEGPFEAEDGVVEAFTGYAGGSIKNPTYEQVSSGMTDAREAVNVFYNPDIVSYQKLLEIYWRQIDPTDEGGQFADRGMHYTTAIFYHNDLQKEYAQNSKKELENSGKFSKISTIIIPFKIFYLAEEYHQDYYKKSADHYKQYKSGSGREKNIKNNLKIFDKIFNNNLESSYTKPDANTIKSMLNDESYAVTQESATERPFYNKYWDNYEPGIYVDIVTGEPLFSSVDKFDSGTGWPSFTRVIDDNFIMEKEDRKLAVTRIEVKSKMGNSHLGHLFKDGPKDKGGMRYCINSAALNFIPLNKMKDSGYEKYLSLFNSNKQ
jgi:peptide methionine sulfoxide reductase msrA/msrB